jgi:hypothetical protein
MVASGVFRYPAESTQLHCSPRDLDVIALFLFLEHFLFIESIAKRGVALATLRRPE